MTVAADRLLASNPLISAHAVRFLKMAGTSRSNFLAGIRSRRDSEVLSLGYSSSPKRTLVSRQSEIHHGVGSFDTYGKNTFFLGYLSPGYHYSEFLEHYHSPQNAVSNRPLARLFLSNHQFPTTVLTALRGRRLAELIDFTEDRIFFGSKHTTIVSAEMHPDDDETLELELAVAWYPLSRALSHL